MRSSRCRTHCICSTTSTLFRARTTLSAATAATHRTQTTRFRDSARSLAQAAATRRSLDSRRTEAEAEEEPMRQFSAVGAQAALVEAVLLPEISDRLTVELPQQTTATATREAMVSLMVAQPALVVVAVLQLALLVTAVLVLRTISATSRRSWSNTDEAVTLEQEDRDGLAAATQDTEAKEAGRLSSQTALTAKEDASL